MKKLKTPLLASCLILALFSGNALGEANKAAKLGPLPSAVTANVNFEINIAKVMLLRVGDWGDQQNTITWSNGISASPGGASEENATEEDWKATEAANTIQVSDNDAEGSDGVLNVAVYSNTGNDVTLSAASAGFVPKDGSSLPTGGPTLADISVESVSSIIEHPGFLGVGETDRVTLKQAGGVVRLEDSWKYSYKPSDTTTGGSYTASVLYTLTSL